MRDDKRNRQRIAQLGDKTRDKMEKAYEQMVREKLDVCVFETIRTQAKQREYVNKGTSKTMRSYHLVGQAVDLVPYDANGNISWATHLFQTPAFKRIVKIMQSHGFSWGFAMWGWDMPHFQNDSIAYGSDTFTGKKKPSVPTPVSKGSIYTQAGQEFINSRDYPNKAGFKRLEVDGFAGKLTMTASIKVYQWFCDIATDGIYGQISERNARQIKRGDDRKWWVHLLQSVLNFNGAQLAVDGIAGSGTHNAIVAYQRANGLSPDGIVGMLTWTELFKH